MSGSTRSRFLGVLFVLALVAVGLAAPAAHAATRNWDGDTSVTWSDANNWDVAPANSLITDIANFNLAAYGGAVFSPNAGTTSINGITIGSGNGVMTLTTTNLSIGNGGIAIANGAGALTVAGTVTIGAGQSWTNSDNDAATFGIIALGTNKLTLAGGDFIFGGANTGTAGSIDLNAGNLIAKVAAAFGPAANTLNFGGGNLELRAAATTYTGKINMTAAGTTITVNPATLLAGVTHIINGAATLGGSRTMVVSAGSLTTINTAYGLTLSGAKTLTGDSTYTINGNGSAAGTLSLITGTIDTQGATRTLTFNSGTGANAAVIGGGFTGSAGTLVLAGSAPVTINALTTTANAVQINSTTGGVYSTAAASTFTGGVTLTSGKLNINSAGVAGTSGPLGNGGTFAINGGTIDNTSGGAKILLNVNPITVGGNFAFSTAAGTALNNLTLPGTVNLGASTRTITANGAGVLTLSGLISNGGLTKAGTGTLVLSNANNSYAGATTINAGTLSLTGSLTGGTAISTSGSGILNQSAAGVISGASSLAQGSAGTSILAGNNSYNGGTTVSAGILNARNANALGTGSVTISGTGGLDLRDAAAGTLNLGSTLDITGAAGANKLYFELASAGSTVDKIAATGAFSMTNSGAGVINLNQLGGTASRLTAGTYDLITAASGITAGGGQFQLTTTRAFGQTFSLADSTTTALKLTTTQVTSATAAAFWKGGSDNWSTASNWNSTVDGGEAAAGAPDYQTNVTFATTTPVPANLATNLVDTDFDINSLNFNAAAGGVTIGGTKMLTIEATTANGNAAGNGINSANTSGTNTVSAPVGLAASQTWTVASGGTLAVSGNISDFGGGYGLTKAGTGTLVLSAANTFAGPITVSAGTLQLSHANALGSSSPTMNFANSTALQLRSDSTATFNTPALTTASGATVTLDVNNNGSGSGNTLTLGGGIQALAGLAGTLNITGGNSYVLSIPTVQMSGNGNLTFNPTTANVSLGTVTANAGSPVVGNVTLTLGGTSTGNSIDQVSDISTVGQQFMINQTGGTWTLGNVLCRGNITLSGGDMVLNGTVTTGYAGNNTGRSISVNGGVLHYNNAGAARVRGYYAQTGNLGYLVMGGGNLDQTSGAAITSSLYDPPMLWSADFTFIGSNGANSDLYLGAGAVTLNATRQVTVQNAATTLTVGGAISGAGFGITKAGPGTLKLSGASTYTGATTITAGTLQPTKTAALPGYNVSGMVVFNGGTLGIPVDGVNWTTGNVDTLLTNATKTAGALGIDTTSGNLTQWTAFTPTNLGVLSLTKLGTNALILNQANTFTGATTVSAGTLLLSNADAVQNSTLTMNGGSAAVVFDSSVTPTAFTFGGLAAAASGAGYDIALQNNAGGPVAVALTVGGNNASTTYAGVLSGAGSLTKAGTGALTLSGTNAYTGATTITAGTLTLSGSGSVNSSSGITVDGSGAKFLQTSSVAASPTVTLTNGTLTGSGTVNTVNVGAGTGGIISNNDGVSGAALTIGTLTLAGGANINLFSGTTAADLAVTTLTNNSALNAVTITANNAGGWTDATYNLISYTTLNGTGANNFAHVVNNLVPRQSATWGDTGSAITLTTIIDNPVWSGANGGTWTTEPTNSPTSGTPNWALKNGHTATDFWAGDKAEFNDTYDIGGGPVPPVTTTVNISTADVSPGSTTFNNSAVNYILNSSGGFGIATGSLTKNGTGTLTITNVNSYSGATSISAGTLSLTGSLTGTAITTSGTGILNESAAGVIGGAASFTQGSSGTSILAGDNTYTGATTITAGTLQLDGNTAAGSTVAIGTAGTLTGSGIAKGNATITGGGIIDFSSTGRIAGTLGATGGNWNGLGSVGGKTTVTSGTFTVANGATMNVGDTLAEEEVSFEVTESSTATIAGTLNVYPETRVYQNGTMDITGTVNTSGRWVAVGSGNSGTARVILEGSGQWNHTYGSGVNASGFVLGEQGDAELTIRDSAQLNAPFMCVASWGGVETLSVIKQDGGTVTLAPTTAQYLEWQAPAIVLGGYGRAEYHLNDGVLNCGLWNGPDLWVSWYGGDPGQGRLYFNGGTLIPNTDDPNSAVAGAVGQTSYMQGLTQVIVQAGGAIIDTDGHNITIAQRLEHDASGPAIDGGLTKQGLGTLTLNGPGASTYTGPTLVSGGKLQLDGNSAAGTLTTSGLTVGAGATLGFTAGTASTLDLTGKPFSLGGTVALDIGASGVNDAMTVNDFTLDGNSALTFNIIGAITNGATYTVLTSANDIDANGFNITGPAGRFTFTPTINTKTVTLTCVLDLGVWNQTGGGSWGTVGNWDNYKPTVAGDAALFGSAITGPATITVGSAHSVGYMRFDDANAYTIGAAGSSNLTLDNGTSSALVVVTSGSHIIAENVALASNTIVAPASGTTLTVSGNLTGAGGVLVSDAGTLVLSGVNTYTGATTIAAGTLEIGGSGQLGGGTYSNTITINPGATFKYNSDANQTFSSGGSGGVIRGGGSFIKDGNGMLTVSEDSGPDPSGNLFTGPITINKGTLKMVGEYAFYNNASTYSIASGAVLDLDANGWAGPATGPTGTTINGAGTLRLSSPVPGGEFWGYYEDEILKFELGSGGLIDLQANVTMWCYPNFDWTNNSARLNVDGEFDLYKGPSVFADALTGAGTVTDTNGTGSSTLTVGVANGSGTFDGTIAGSVAFTKTGSGTQTLTGTNTYTGATTVNAGKLLVDGEQSLATGAVTVASTGTLGGNGFIGGAVTVNGTLAPGTAGIGTLTVGTEAAPKNVTMEATAIYNFDITSPTNADKVDIMGTGIAVFAAGWQVVLSNGGGGAPLAGDKYYLFSYDAIANATTLVTPIFSAGTTDWGVTGASIGKNSTGVYITGITSYMLGDTNGDKVVDAADYIAIKTNFGLSGTGITRLQGDLVDNDVVDWDDLQQLMANFGRTLGGAPATPEPATLGLLAIGALALLRRRRAA